MSHEQCHKVYKSKWSKSTCHIMTNETLVIVYGVGFVLIAFQNTKLHSGSAACYITRLLDILKIVE